MRKYLCCLVFAGCALLAAAAPYARIPRLTSPPPVDEPRHLFSWWEATAFCGLVNASSATDGPQYLGGHLDATFWVGYDDRALYLAAIAAAPDISRQFLTSTREADDPRLLDDDHWVIQLSLRAPAEAAAKPYLRLRVNSLGAVLAEEVNHLPGQDRTGWANRLTCLSVVREKMGTNLWVLRLAIPLRELGVDSLDGLTARLHLALATDPFYLSWGGGRPDQWELAGEVVFDPRMPVSPRLNASRGGLLPVASPDGRATISLHAVCHRGTLESPMELHWEIVNRTPDGEVLWQRQETQRGVGNERLRAVIQEPFPRAAENHLHFTATAMEPGAPPLLLYRDQLPFRLPDDALNARLETWSAARTITWQAEIQCDYIYSPYANRVFTSVDLRQPLERLRGEELAKAQRWLTADALRVALVDAAGNSVTDASFSVRDGYGEGVLTPAGPLPEGAYELRYTLLADGAELVVRARPLTRQVFPWEHTALGRDRVVIPPWSPVDRQGASLRVWGRDYRLAGTGLPAQIRSRDRELLAAPITLEAATPTGPLPLQEGGAPAIALQPGQRIPAEFAAYEQTQGACPPPPLLPVDGYEAAVTGAGRLGDLQLQLAATLGYEGWYHVRLRLLPAAPVQLDRLDLVIPLAADATIMRWMRAMSPGVALSGCGAIPAGDGVLYTNRDLPLERGPANLFVPEIYVGTPGEGLWWLAESCQGWIVDDAAPLQSLVRRDGRLELRLHLVNTPATIAAPRDLEFVLLASPTRPRPPDFRRRFYQGLYSHDTAGFRLYGSGVDGFTLYEDADYDALRRFLYESPEFLRKTRRAREEGGPIILYGSTFMASAGMREFPTFGSTWIKTADLARHARPLEEYRGKTNRGGSYTWQTDPEVTAIATTMDDSFIDCHLWHMARIGERCAINGTFYDNYQLYPGDRVTGITDITGADWRRDDGTVEPRATVFRRHAWTKRYSTMHWLMGRPPMQFSGNEPESTFTSVWFVEGVNDVEGGSNYLADGKDLHTYAAWTTTSGGVAWSNASIAPIGDRDHPQVNVPGVRVALAYCLLLDLPLRPKGWPYREPIETVVDALDQAVGFFGDAELVPYWRSAEWIGPLPPGLVVGGYRSIDHQHLVLVVLNTTTEAITFDLPPGIAQQVAQKPILCRDLERNSLIPMASRVRIPGQDFRLLVLGPE